MSVSGSRMGASWSLLSTGSWSSIWTALKESVKQYARRYTCPISGAMTSCWGWIGFRRHVRSSHLESIPCE